MVWVDVGGCGVCCWYCWGGSGDDDVVYFVLCVEFCCGGYDFCSSGRVYFGIIVSG